MSIRKQSKVNVTCDPYSSGGWTVSVPKGGDPFSNWISEAKAWTCGEYGSVSNSTTLSTSKQFSIPLPDWTKKHEGFNECAYSFGGNPKLVVIQYNPTTTLGVGFATIHLVDPSTDERVPMMDSIYKVVVEMNKGSSKRDYTMTDDGVVRGPFGNPDISTITSIVQDMTQVYLEWKDFPNETDYAVIRQLKTAKEKIKKMRYEVGHKTIETQISEKREAIQDAQKEIADLEKKLNRIYEEAADAMNLLEEHGVKVEDPDKWDEENARILDGSDLVTSFDTSKLIDPQDIALWTNAFIKDNGGSGLIYHEDITPCRVYTNEETRKIIENSLSSKNYTSIGTSSAS